MSLEDEIVERIKSTYERLDTLYAALPEMNREEFLEMTRELNRSNQDSVLWRATNRWLRQHS